MTHRASRLMTLHGMTLLVLNALGALSGVGGGLLPFAVLAAIGALSLIVGARLRHSPERAVGLALGLCIAGIAAGAAFTAQSLLGLFGARAGDLLTVGICALSAASAAVALPAVHRARARVQRLRTLLGLDRE